MLLRKIQSIEIISNPSRESYAHLAGDKYALQLPLQNMREYLLIATFSQSTWKLFSK